jgi:DNA-binding protein YbaB
MLNPVEVLKMQNDAKKLQKKLRERKIKGESKNGRVVIYMNGAQEFEDVHIDDEYLSPDMSEALKKGFKDMDQLRNMFSK